MKVQRKSFLIVSSLISLVLTHGSLVNAAPVQHLMVAAASDLRFAMEELKGEFEKENTGTLVDVTTGSSGKFYEQIKGGGAPFDVFFSADQDFPQKLNEAGLAGKVIPYAIGKMVVWSTRYPVRGIEDLKDKKFKKIAIANPEHAPYGKRAKEALEKTGVMNEVKDRLVYGENISQTAQFVETGAADAGIVALSLVLSPSLKGKGTIAAVADKWYSPLVQGFVVLKKSPTNPASEKFAQFIQSEPSKRILKKYGFDIPKDATWTR